MGNFREFIEAASGLLQGNWVALDKNKSLAQGRDKAETWIKGQLYQHGVAITGAGQNEDKYMKIDGYWNGQPVQIKTRTIKPNGRDDIAYELLKSYVAGQPIGPQFKEQWRWGRDFKCNAAFYFLLNQSQTHIHQINAADLKAMVSLIVNEISPMTITRNYQSRYGADVRCVNDYDAHLHTNRTGYKLLAFIPVQKIVNRSYPIK